MPKINVTSQKLKRITVPLKCGWDAIEDINRVSTLPTLTEAVKLLPPPQEIKLNIEDATLLELTNHHVKFSAPDGRSFIEARANGEVIIRGEEAPVRNQDIYLGLIDWMKSLGIEMPKEK